MAFLSVSKLVYQKSEKKRTPVKICLAWFLNDHTIAAITDIATITA